MAKSDRPSRTLPDHPNLRILKDEAKRRVKQREFTTLAEAQLAIAREYGFASWPRLKGHVESHSVSARGIAGDPAATMLAAVKAGDMKRLRELIAEGADVDEFEDETALSRAAALGRSAMAKELLKAGADVNFGGLAVPLCGAAGSGHAQVVKLLLAAGADVERSEEQGITPLMAAAAGGHLDVVKMLIAADADPKAVDSDGRTALDIAMANRRAKVVEFLKRFASKEGQASIARRAHLLREQPEKKPQPAKAKPEPAKAANRKAGPSPLLKAFESLKPNVRRIQQLLAEGADPNAANADGNTVLCLACARCHHEGWPEVVRVLLEAGADPNRPGEEYSPLHLAIMFGDADIVRVLLKAGADVNARDVRGVTPVMAASDDEGVEILQVLLDAGADANAKDDQGHNALWHALDGNWEEAANLLRGVTQDTESAERPWRSEQFGTPELRFLWAAGRGDLDMVRKLLKAGVKPDVGDEYADTASHKAAQAGHLEVLKALMQAGVGVDLPGIGERTVLQSAASGGNLQMVEYLLKAGADVNAKDAYGQTPLWEAAKACQLPMVERLLAAGAEVNVATKGSHGTTPFLAAIGRDEPHRRMMRLLAEHGADVHAVDQYGRSAVALADRDLSRDDSDARALRELLRELGLLSVDAGRLTVAAGEGDLDTVRKLIESGTSPDAVDEEERTPLYMAVSRRRPEVVAYLLKAGADPNKAIGRDGEADTVWGGIEVPCPKCKTPFIAMVNPRRCPKCGKSFDTRKALGAGRTDLPLYVSWHNGFTPLMAAAKLNDAKTVRMLIDARAKINRGNGDITPLMGACHFGHLDVAKVLIEKGADVKKVAKEPGRSGSKVTAVEIAGKAGHIELVKLLWDAGAPASDKEQTLLVDACKRGDVKAIRKLLSDGADPNEADPLTQNEPLEAAAKAGHPDAVEALIKAGAVVVKPASRQFPVLISIADKFQRREVAKGDQDRYLAVARILLDAGARATVSVFGVTPLSLAEESKCKPLIEILRAAAEREKAAKKKR